MQDRRALAVMTAAHGIQHFYVAGLAVTYPFGVACEAAGLPGRAESAYRRCVQDSGDLPFFRAWAGARLGACLARQGQPGEAAPHVRAALAGGTPLTWFEARWAHAELLASRGEDEARRAVAAAALEAARQGGYLILILVPRLRELAG